MEGVAGSGDRFRRQTLSEGCAGAGCRTTARAVSAAEASRSADAAADIRDDGTAARQRALAVSAAEATGFDDEAADARDDGTAARQRAMAVSAAEPSGSDDAAADARDDGTAARQRAVVGWRATSRSERLRRQGRPGWWAGPFARHKHRLRRRRGTGPGRRSAARPERGFPFRERAGSSTRRFPSPAKQSAWNCRGGVLARGQCHGAKPSSRRSSGR